MGRIVAIIGRPNVGKSTLFNRLTKSRDAIVDELSGVTRDRKYGRCEWNGVSFSVIDTGGYVKNSEDVFEEEINKQVLVAMGEADLILFMVDVTHGIHELDVFLADVLRRINKKILLVVNKVDNNRLLLDAAEFYSLGMGNYFPVSSVNGSGTGDLLDEVVKSIHVEIEEDIPDIPRIAIVGRPNVGKSSLVNSLLGEERNIVTPVAGTTRDSIFTRYRKFNHDFMLVDTAGLRKKGKINEDVEFYSVMRAIRAIEHSDICLLLIDATRGIESQDLNIVSLISNNGKGLIILVNKWDLIEKENNTAFNYEKELRRKTEPFTDYPVLFISAVNRQRIHKILELIDNVNENRKRTIPTSEINDVMQDIIKSNPPPALKGEQIKIKYITQLPTSTPSFAFFCNLPQYVKDPYKRFLENRIREKFKFSGVPLRIYFRKK
jgi:GTP-binding protein